MRNCQKLLLLALTILIQISLVSGSYQASYPYYMDVNTTETIYFYNNFSNSSMVYINFEGISNDMTYDSVNDRMYANVLSESEDDVYFEIVEIAEDTIRQENTDTSREDSVTIDNNDEIYASKINITDNLYLSADVIVCATLSSSVQNKNIVFKVGVTNESDDTIMWFDSDIDNIIKTDYNIYCKTVSAQSLNQTNFTAYYGVQCIDCDNPGSLLLGQDTNGTDYNLSYTFSNETDYTPTQENDNLMLIMLYPNGTELHDEVKGIMRFRVPFYLNVNLFHTTMNNDTDLHEPYLNDFQYLFLQNHDDTASKSWMDSSIVTFSWVDELFYKIFGVAYDDSIDIDTTLSYWGRYEDGSAPIKLYEADNYDFNLATIDATTSLGWGYEFIYPQFTDAQYYNDIVTFNITEESNQTIEIFIDNYEISKFNFIKNIMKNLLFIALWFALVIMTAMISRDGRITSIVATTTFALLLGVLGLT